MINIRILLNIILVAMLIFGGCGRQEPAKPIAKKSEGQASIPEVEMSSVEETRVERVSERDLTGGMFGRDDPFAPITIKPTDSVKRKKGELNLEGVITGPGQPLAMINDKIVKEGDIIDGKKIIKIDIESVTFEDADGKKHILRLF